ncbi:response regulator [Litorilinea aerophila]|uniref:histidine kinase n=1 Tax=Litorilinea aerophila TaxID=1204385 RepID=A0A540VGE7_9CHLR|nr:response regulator [Litorilinea aerophila]MCC9077162.1 response regulator [Litorilinea aerophila]
MMVQHTNHILLIEDNPGDARLIQEYLRMAPAFPSRLTHRDRLEKALQFLQESPVDVILLDLNLPDSQGFDTFRAVQNHAPDTPILLLTGLDDEEFALEAVRAGAQDYLVKGQVDSSLLVRAIRYAIERRQAQEMVRQRNATVKLLQEIAVAANESTNVEQALHFAMERICTHIGWPLAHAYMANPARRTMDSTDIWYIAGETERFAPFIEATRPLCVRASDPGGLIHAVYTTGQPLWLENACTEPLFQRAAAAAAAGLGAGFAFPALIGQEVVAVLEFYTTEPRPTDHLLMEVLLHIGAQLGRVVERERIRNQERLATVGQLAAGIAHDFNNVMSVIALYSEMLRRNPHHPKNQHYLATISQQARHATNLINQILDFSRRSVIHLEHMDLLALIQKVVDMLRRTLPENIQVQLEHEPGPFLVHADATRIQQVLMNLAVNARDAMPHGGELRFSLSHRAIQPAQKVPVADMKPGSYVRLSVADTGHGIDPQHLSHIFEPFFTTKEPGKGAGLGLAQVYGIVKQHHGEILVDSRVGQGTTFTLYLPEVHLDPPTPKEGEQDREAFRGSETLLVVEDNEAARNALVELLEGLGYRVLVARDGEEAASIFEASSREIALIVCDLVMPRLGGLELYTRLRQNHPELKMLIVTGYPLGAGDKEILETGLVEWLQKPPDADELGRRIRKLIDRQRVPDRA